MKKLVIAAAFMALGGLSAHAAEKVKVMETVKVAAPPATVWEKIGHFSDMSWHPAVKSTDASDGDKGDSQRRLDLGGPTLWEAIVANKPAAHSYTYRILDNGSNQKVLPVTGYVSTISVKPDGAGSEVVWSATFVPVAGTTADAAHKAVAGVYRGGLDALAKGFAKN